MTPQLTEIVSLTQGLLTSARKNLIRVAQNLKVIKDHLTPGESFGDFVEEYFGISQSMASKLLTVNRVYLLEGGVAPEEIQDIDFEKLYLARKTEGTVEEKIHKARVQPRAHLREQEQEDVPHEFQLVEICGVCGGKREFHA